jgi:hypothetical protein
VLCKASPMGFETTISTVTGWRALRTAPRGRICFRVSVLLLVALRSLLIQQPRRVEPEIEVVDGNSDVFVEPSPLPVSLLLDVSFELPQAAFVIVHRTRTPDRRRIAPFP